jgi:ATP-dependent DNA ligase
MAWIFLADSRAFTRALDALLNETLIDGEVLAVDENGLPSFSDLQNFDRALMYAFDLPILAGRGPEAAHDR